MKLCVKCGLSHDDDADACRRCGSLLIDSAEKVQTPRKQQKRYSAPARRVRLCPGCGEAVPENKPVCPYCSQPLDKTAVVDQSVQLTSFWNKKERREKRFLFLRYVLLAFWGTLAVAALFAAIILGSGTPLFTLVFIVPAALEYLFPDALFRWQTWLYFDRAEPSKFYYRMTKVSSFVFTVFSVFVLATSIYSAVDRQDAEPTPDFDMEDFLSSFQKTEQQTEPCGLSLALPADGNRQFGIKEGFNCTTTAF